MRTTIDIPDPVYRRLKARAASEGRSVKALILRAAEQALAVERVSSAGAIAAPVIASKRPGSLRLDNARIYDVISFP
jgi:plasmid stability protein